MDRDFSWYVSKIYDWLREKAEELVQKLKKKTSPYFDQVNYYYRLLVKRFDDKWQKKWKPVLRYGVLSFIPYVLVYGILLNLVTYHFLSLDLTPTSIASHGLVWYFVKEEVFGEMIPELRPTLTADVKVKNR